MSGDLELKEKLEKANNSFFLGCNLMTDEEYDQSIEYAEMMGLNIKTTSGIKISNGVSLPLNMESMNKAKTPEMFKRWKTKYPGPYIVSAKMDGISVLIDGNKAYTRGDGGIGQDITWIKEALDLPDSPNNYMVRGELIMEKSKWEENKVALGVKTPLSFVAGLSNRRFKGGEADIESAKKLSYVAFQLIEKEGTGQKKPSEQYELLKNYGFNIPTYAKADKVTWTTEINNCEVILEKIRNNTNYYLDGIIFTPDREFPRVDDTNPPYSMAYKDSVIITAVVKDVEWSVSKNDKLAPVVIIEKSEVDGKTFERVTGHNLAFIKKFSIGKGSIVTINIKSVPNISAVTNNEDIKPILPKTSYKEEGPEAISTDAELWRESAIKRIAFFFKTIGAKGIESKTISKLYECGYKSIESILEADEEVWKSAIGKNNGTKLRNIAYESISVAPVESIMAGSSFFPDIGKSIFSSITSVIGYGGIMDNDLRSCKDRLSGIGESRISIIETNKAAFGVWFEKLKELTNYRIPNPVQERTDLINVEMTGNPPNMSKNDFAATYGFKIVSLKKAKMLITNSLDSETSKMSAALASGIPIKTFTDIINGV